MTRHLKARHQRIVSVVASIVMFAATVLVSGCGQHATKGAAEGAATGAIAGAVGGMMSALVFGGDVGEAAARGAVWGGSTGAVAGGMAGAQSDARVREQEAAKRQAEIDRFRQEIGPDAFNGVVALAECKHEIAIANAREAARSGKRDYAVAGIWVEALTEADRGNEDGYAAMLPELVAKDRDVGSEAVARERTAEALEALAEIRTEHGLPAACKR